MPEITIHIYEASDGGYMYDIWKGDPQHAADTINSDDGGHCISNIHNALDMAAAQAEALFINQSEEAVF